MCEPTTHAVIPHEDCICSDYNRTTWKAPWTKTNDASAKNYLWINYRWCYLLELLTPTWDKEISRRNDRFENARFKHKTSQFSNPGRRRLYFFVGSQLFILKIAIIRQLLPVKSLFLHVQSELHVAIRLVNPNPYMILFDCPLLWHLKTSLFNSKVELSLLVLIIHFQKYQKHHASAT